MAPNLFVAARTVCQPHTWFQTKQPSAPLTRTEIWLEPTPGVYKHTPGCGWSLIATGNADGVHFNSLDQPRKVTYCKVIHRWIFQDEVEARSRQGFFMDRPEQKTPVTFFCLDDGFTWVQSLDKRGKFVPGPYQRFVLDSETRKFRPMLRYDDPTWEGMRRSSYVSGHSASAVSSLHDTTPGDSRRTSMELSLPQFAESSRRGNFAVPNARPSIRHQSSSTKSGTCSPSPLATEMVEK